MAMKLKIGDLVWAKRKSYPPWPAIVSDPGEYRQAGEKFDSYEHFILYYGTYNHAWIGHGDNIWPYAEFRDRFLIKENPPQGFKEAVDRIERVLNTRVPSKDPGCSEKIEANGGFASASNGSSAAGDVMQAECSTKPKPRKLSREEREAERVTKFFKTVKPELFPTSDDESAFKKNVKDNSGMEDALTKLSDAELMGFMKFLASDSEEPEFDNTPIDLAALCGGKGKSGKKSKKK